MHEWLYGRNAVYEALRAGRRQFFRLRLAIGVEEKGRLSLIVKTCQQYNIPLERVSRSQLDSLGVGHQGVALETSSYPYSHQQDILRLAEQRKEAPFLLILDSLQDPQNLGTLLRTADAVGVHGVFLPLRHTATVTPAMVNASSGASEHLLITQANLAQTIQSLKEAGIWIVGMEVSPEAKTLDQVSLDGPLALVVGSEAEGLRHLISQLCDFLLRLPMRGRIESLNAAVAGSIALYMAWQARNPTNTSDFNLPQSFL